MPGLDVALQQALGSNEIFTPSKLLTHRYGHTDTVNHEHYLKLALDQELDLYNLIIIIRLIYMKRRN